MKKYSAHGNISTKNHPDPCSFSHTEEGQVFAPDRTKEHGRYVSSEAHVAFLDQLKTHWTWEDNKNVSCSLCPKVPVFNFFHKPLRNNSECKNPACNNLIRQHLKAILVFPLSAKKMFGRRRRLSMKEARKRFQRQQTAPLQTTWRIRAVTQTRAEMQVKITHKLCRSNISCRHSFNFLLSSFFLLKCRKLSLLVKQSIFICSSKFCAWLTTFSQTLEKKLFSQQTCKRFLFFFIYHEIS